MTGTLPREQGIRVLVVDDHPAMRHGLRNYIDSEPDMTVVGEAADGITALDEFLRLRPDVTLMDLQMQAAGGLQAIGAIRSHDRDAVVIVLTTYPGDARVRRAMSLGATSYLLKSCPAEAIIDAIRGGVLGQSVTASSAISKASDATYVEELSPRELQVMQHIAEGATNFQIAEALHVSEETIKSHVKSILGKLSARDRTHAVAIARRRGHLDP